MAKLLVTGGAGFIGSHLCEALLKRGDDVFGAFGIELAVEHAHPAPGLGDEDLTRVVQRVGFGRAVVAVDRVADVFHESRKLPGPVTGGRRRRNGLRPPTARLPGTGCRPGP